MVDTRKLTTTPARPEMKINKKDIECFQNKSFLANGGRWSCLKEEWMGDPAILYSFTCFNNKPHKKIFYVYNLNAYFLAFICFI